MPIQLFTIVKFEIMPVVIQLYLPIAIISLMSIQILIILDAFAKLSSTKSIYWQICQTLVLPFFVVYST